MEKYFEDFVRVAPVSDKVIEKYKNKVPDEMIEFWKEYGFGSFSNGYLKSVNPDDFEDILIEGSQRFHDGIVLFTTSMGDLIIWSDNYVRVLNFRYGINDTVMAGFKFFFEDIFDIEFRDEELKWSFYSKAVELYGIPDYDECFGYVPILGIGGSEKVENLEKVKIREYLLIIINFMGPIE